MALGKLVRLIQLFAVSSILMVCSPSLEVSANPVTGFRVDGDVSPSNAVISAEIEELNYRSTLCNSHNVVLSKGGKIAAFGLRDSFARFDLFESISGSSYVLTSFPSTATPTKGVILPGRDLRNLTFANNKFESNNKVWVGGFFGGINMFDISDKNRTLLKTQIKAGEDGSSPEHAYTNVSNASWNFSFDKLKQIEDTIENDKSKLSTYFKRTKTYDGRVATLVFQDEIYLIGSKGGQNLKLRLPNGEIKSIDNKIDAFGFNDFQIVGLANGQEAIYSLGTLIPITKAQTLTPISLPYYSKIVRTFDSKKIQLSHDWNNITPLVESSRASANRLQKEVNIWRKQNWYLVSASYDLYSQRAALIFQDFSNKVRGFAFLDLKAKSIIRKTCEDKSSASFGGNIITQNFNYVERDVALPPKSKYSFKTKRLQAGAWDTGITYIKPNKTIVGTYVIIRGGPMANNSKLRIEGYYEALLDRGWILAFLEYSGSIDVSPTLYKRLSLDRTRAVENDATVFAKEIDKVREKKPLVLEGNSFGSALTSFLDNRLKTAPDLVFLSIPAGDEDSVLNRISSNQNKDLAEMVLAAYGSPIDKKGNDIQIWWKSVRNGLCGKEYVHAYFGARDSLVSKKSWQDTCGLEFNTTTFENGYHAISEEYGSAILKEVDKLSPNKAK